MRCKLLSGVATSALFVVLANGFASGALAADLSVKAPPAQYFPAWSWTGGYLGFHIGAAFGEAKFSDPFGPSIFGDRVRTPAFLGGGQIGYNWQAPGTPWVFGVETDISGMDSDGTNTCFAFSGFFLSANCRVRPELTGTITGRIGYAGGPQGQTLYYVKGGAAWLDEKVDMATNALIPPFETSATVTKWGGTVGAGVEQALSPAWSIKLEYDYTTFGGNSLATPTGFFQVAPPANLFAAVAGTTSVTHDIHEVKIGLNYRIGADPWARWPVVSSAYPVKAMTAVAPAAGWEFDVGGRYWYSWGRFQKDLGATASAATANVLVSRLTYDTKANSGEFFGRIETPWNLFVKGFVGGGRLSSGHMNDEDWAIFDKTGTLVIPYSNTVSDSVKGTIGYATVDVGYDFFRAPGQKLGAFVGYNYFKENKDAFGCTQIANSFSDCSPTGFAPPVPSSVLVVSENDTWNSLRVGVNGEIMVGDRLKLSGDVAYIPYLKFTGLDIHHQRFDVPSQNSPETGNGGHGVQLEGVLSYYLTPAFSLGVGGRYWAMWTNQDASTNIFGFPCPCQTLPSKTERAGVFFQGSYKFD
jgi:opacity protein-like surface antigen/outer membrane protease